MRALPDEEREIKKLPRAWINNVINTLDDGFAKWVRDMMKDRTETLFE